MAKKAKVEPMDVRVGDTWKVGDPRDGKRTIKITHVAKERVSFTTNISGRAGSADRARFNGKKSGYILVTRG